MYKKQITVLFFGNYANEKLINSLMQRLEIVMTWWAA